ncbi:uncharacterized protein LOC130967247 [Arachis stenosperma]|uniref:uncharacterized protein LOC130967247 n=1 Tax=Arachis stenosperma TaxID=217475 RepID=UPI0025ABB3FC|nr:uncharacterized protein LOC130967247 [Arachis stenosperma]
MRQPRVLGEATGFGARDAEGSAGMTEFQVGQQFQDKEDALLSVKTYSIRRGVQYKVVESDYRRYVGKCSEFGNGCTWLIRLSLSSSDYPVRVGRQLDESQAYFHRLFWTFSPCIETFRHCKPLVSIDGTHLYGKYGGTLLVAIAQDGNSNILPVAFALVEAANFALTFKGKDARRLLVNAAYAKTEVEFDYWFDILRSEDPTMCDWANRIEYSLWTQYCDEGRRFGHMTTNISECVNSILKGVRNLLVCSLVKATYGRLAELFVRKGREAEAQLGIGQQFSQHLVKCIETNLKTARCFTVTLYDRDNSEYTVAETTLTGSFSLGIYRVSLGSQTCDCGYFQALHFPCPHALACCAYSRVTWHSYVHPVYRLSNVFSVYQMGFRPPIPEGFWPPYDGPTVIPDPNKRRAREGRPRSTRIRTNMDEADPNRPKRCGLCRQPGHTRQSCPQVGGSQGIQS